MTNNVYCGRIGGPVKRFTDRCPECGGTPAYHTDIPDNICGAFARCPNRTHGHPCTRPPGHGGAHHAEPEPRGVNADIKED